MKKIIVSIACIGISIVAFGSNPPSNKCHFTNTQGDNVNGRVETYHENYGTDTKRSSNANSNFDANSGVDALGLKAGIRSSDSSSKSTEVTSYNNSGYNEGTRCRKGSQASQNGDYEDGWKK